MPEIRREGKYKQVHEGEISQGKAVEEIKRVPNERDRKGSARAGGHEGSLRTRGGEHGAQPQQVPGVRPGAEGGRDSSGADESSGE